MSLFFPRNNILMQYYVLASKKNCNIQVYGIDKSHSTYFESDYLLIFIIKIKKTKIS